MKQRLFILDGTALCYRAHFAFVNNPLINSRGQHTSALYGIISSFIKIYEDFDPEYFAITFDSKEKTFRHNIYEAYKANRPLMPEELISQIDPIVEFFKLAEIKTIFINGVEADDLIGSLAKKFENNLDIVIVSGDKDFIQLVSKNICLFDPKNRTFVREDHVYAKYEIMPFQFTDYLALVGDSSDNIPGASGIGHKTAIKLLKLYENIDNLYMNIENIASISEKNKLISSKENVFLSKTLATIKTDIDIQNTTLKSLSFDLNNLKNTFDFLDFYELKIFKKNIMTKLSLMASHMKSESQNLCYQNGNIDEGKFIFSEEQISIQDNVDTIASQPIYTLVKTMEQLISTVNSCNTNIIAIDIKTTTTDSMKAELIGISFCFSIGEAFYVPLNHTFTDNLNWYDIVPLIKKLMTGKTIIGHNLKFVIQIFKRHGLNVEDMFFLEAENNSKGEKISLIFDTMLAAYILEPGKNKYVLKDCAKKELDIDITPITELIGKGKNQSSFALIELETACHYAAKDAYVIFCLYNAYKNRLKTSNLYELYINIEIPLIFALAYIEMQGVCINIQDLNKLNNEITEQINTLTYKIYEIAGESFNINSTVQLSQILFNKLKINPVKKTQTGYSTDIEVLEALASKNIVARHLIEYRHLYKMKTTYIETLPSLVNQSTRRIHTSFNQTITSTGRLSSSNPNLQNIPIKTELGFKIRKSFIVPKGKIMVSADYSQIELRLLAIMSKDTNMINAFQNGIDIHTNTASIIFKKQQHEVDNNERRKAKVINFGIIYGMGANSLSKELQIPLLEAKEFIKNYFSHFPTIKSFIEKQKQLAHQNGFAETLFRRRLYLPDINVPNQRAVAEAERLAINMPIQGTAADIIKIAMINIYQKIYDRNDIKMLIQVHDELVFEIDFNSLEEAKQLIRFEMENAFLHELGGTVPLVADINEGTNWSFES